MTPYVRFEQPRGQEDLATARPGLEHLARIGGLRGEVAAALAVPAKERDRHRHNRLRAITKELDRRWEKLCERAERLGRGDGCERTSA
jgi:hypothetical protein